MHNNNLFLWIIVPIIFRDPGFQRNNCMLSSQIRLHPSIPEVDEIRYLFLGINKGDLHDDYFEFIFLIMEIRLKENSIRM